MNKTVAKFIDSPTFWVLVFVLTGVLVLLCQGCSMLSPTMKAEINPDLTGDKNIVTGVTIQEASTLMMGLLMVLLLLLMSLMMLKGAWTLWLSHRREMVRIQAAKKPRACRADAVETCKYTG